MKTHIIRDTKVGIAAMTSVFAKSMTTWSLEYAREDKKERNNIAFKTIKDEKKLIQKMIKNGLVTTNDKGEVSEKDVKEASKMLDDALASLAATYDIDL